MMKPITYRGYTIRSSGKNFFKAVDSVGMVIQRAETVAQAKVLIDVTVEHRVMTEAEHKLVYPEYWAAGYGAAIQSAK
jgi:hypothetical protein